MKVSCSSGFARTPPSKLLGPGSTAPGTHCAAQHAHASEATVLPTRRTANALQRSARPKGRDPKPKSLRTQRQLNHLNYSSIG